MGRRAALVVVLLWGASAGCAGIGARESRLRDAIADRRERAEAARGLSGASGVVLARLGLLDAAANDPAGAARALERRLDTRPEPDGALALAELSYRAGLERQRSSPPTAMAWYRDAAALAALAVGDPAGTRPDVAVRVHNFALARLIRIAQRGDVRDGQSWRRVLGEEGLAPGSPESYLDPGRLADLRVAGDLQVSGMDHVYRSDGLGVPLVAHRLADPRRSPDPRDQFLPREARVGATALLMPDGELRGGDWRRRPPALLLLDPFDEATLDVGGRQVPLASDRTAPLAMQVARGQFSALEWAGLFESSFQRPGVDAGLYMLRPYEPGKIPVVLVHGLVSSPRAWIQTINELRNSPAIAARYQFWVFLYPTGLPIPLSAARLRESLLGVRETLDPGHADGALERMVLVGHSMGGLLSKMMAQDSGLLLWDSTIRVPHDRFRGSAELRRTLDDVLVFRPLPFVRRTVFIATPHRGSPLANDLIGRVVSSLVRGPHELAAYVAEIEEENGPDVISPELRGRVLNAVGNLRTDSPILAALDRIPIDPAVPYHSIIPLIGGFTGTDGVVEYRSSHLAGAASEQIVAGTHFSQRKIEVTRELRRILLEHLADIDHLGTARNEGPDPAVRVAGAPGP